ncbi:MAG TPA: pitrilysin family protein [Myxococcota bacterium]|nr:pitrilysin family protein [Myxococcota bacterium]
MSAAAGSAVCIDSHVVGQAKVELYRLGNGLEVLAWEDHGAPVVSLQTWFRVGARHDPEGRSGIAHLFEHLMFKATANRAEGDYDRLMEARGAQTNAATWVDWTYYKAKLPKWELAFALELESDRMEHLALNTDMLEREREVVKNERLMRVDNDPEGLLSERLYREVYREHPYGVPTIGWMEDIERISLEDCNAFYRTHYAPNNATLVVVGDFDTTELLGLVERFYGHMPAVELVAEREVVEAAIQEERRLELELPLSSPRIVKAWRAYRSGTREHAALDVACELLVGGDSARLHRRLVEELELAIEVSGWVSSWAQPGILELSLTLRPEADVAETEAALMAELERFFSEPPTEHELEKAKNGLEADFLRGLADVGSRARQLGHHRATIGDFKEFWREGERLASVTLDEVIAAARDVLVPGRLVTAIAVPDGSEPEEGDDEDDGDDEDNGGDEALADDGQDGERP